MAIHINKHASKEHYKNETGSGRGKMDVSEFLLTTFKVQADPIK